MHELDQKSFAVLGEWCNSTNSDNIKVKFRFHLRGVQKKLKKFFKLVRNY